MNKDEKAREKSNGMHKPDLPAETFMNCAFDYRGEDV